MDKIKIFGAREHNLKNVSLEIPKNSLVVITGPSGSGKSSLAMETLFAEGQRRYVESLSSYARQFLGISHKPDVDKIEGLCPAIAIEQKTVGYNPRSTVGTTTEIYDYLRVLFARIGDVFCPSCNASLKPETPESVARSLVQKYPNEVVMVAAELAQQKKGEFKILIKEFFIKGFRSFFIDGNVLEFDSVLQIDKLNLQKTQKHSIYVVVDSLLITEKNQDYLFSGVKKAFTLSKGSCTIIFPNKNHYCETYLSTQICLKCVLPFPKLEPRLFSFNSPVGACEHCNGLGVKFSYGGLFDIDEDFDPDQVGMVTCTRCEGSRLNIYARFVKIADKNIFDVCQLSLDEVLFFFSNLSLNEVKTQIADRVLAEIKARLSFLVNVGVEYLNLARNAGTLSGGEAQRIRLGTQIGTALSGVLYVLDEPSIGLHQRDNHKLIDTMKRLRDLNNSVVVVEHDQDTMNAADWLIDIGPGAGIHGGYVVASGTPVEVSLNPESVTGKFLSGKRSILVPKSRRTPTKFLNMIGVSKNNLKNIDVLIPLGVFLVVTGVSGSGKSSLIMQVLAVALNNYFQKGYAMAAGIKELLGIEQINNLVFVDQKTIGRSVRSNPATYLGIFNDIRNIFAGLAESKARGYTPGHFSFNVRGGRCDECDGEGKKRISMQFLEDVVMVCPLCNGKRYDQFVLEIKFEGKNISDVLDLTVAEALILFKSFPGIAKRLQLMCDVGLDYITLGQPSNTISGGEAQRIKLVNELAKRGQGTCFILDEPTTGLHFQDIEKLLVTLNRLVDRGNSVIVIEHNLDLIKCADYIIDVGPGGGKHGGTILCQGTPEQVVKVKESFTGQYLKPYLN